MLHIFVAGECLKGRVVLRASDCTYSPESPGLQLALEASQAGAALRAGSVLYIARLPDKGRAAVHMHMVAGSELTEAALEAARLTASQA